MKKFLEYKLVSTALMFATLVFLTVLLLQLTNHSMVSRHGQVEAIGTLVETKQSTVETVPAPVSQERLHATAENLSSQSSEVLPLSAQADRSTLKVQAEPVNWKTHEQYLTSEEKSMLQSLITSSAHQLDWRKLSVAEERELTSNLIQLGTKGIRQVAHDLWNFSAGAVAPDGSLDQGQNSRDSDVSLTISKIDFLLSLALRGHKESKEILAEISKRPFLELDAAAQAVSIESFQALAAADHQSALEILKQQRQGYRKQFMHEYEVGRVFRGVTTSQARQELASSVAYEELTNYIQRIDNM